MFGLADEASQRRNYFNLRSQLCFTLIFAADDDYNRDTLSFHFVSLLCAWRLVLVAVGPAYQVLRVLSRRYDSVTFKLVEHLRWGRRACKSIHRKVEVYEPELPPRSNTKEARSNQELRPSRCRPRMNVLQVFERLRHCRH